MEERRFVHPAIGEWLRERDRRRGGRNVHDKFRVLESFVSHLVNDQVDGVIMSLRRRERNIVLTLIADERVLHLFDEGPRGVFLSFVLAPDECIVLTFPAQRFHEHVSNIDQFPECVDLLVQVVTRRDFTPLNDFYAEFRGA